MRSHRSLPLLRMLEAGTGVRPRVERELEPGRRQEQVRELESERLRVLEQDSSREQVRAPVGDRKVQVRAQEQGRLSSQNPRPHR